jgi:hypothetical protein
MHEPEHEVAPMLSTLEYVSKRTTATRTSKLAVAALIFSLLAFSALLVPVSRLFNFWLTRLYMLVGRHLNLHPAVVLVAMIVATPLSLAALIRIRISEHRLSGVGIAWSALIISLFSWGVLAVVFALFSIMAPHPT